LQEMAEIKAVAAGQVMRVVCLIGAASACAAPQTSAEELIAAGHWKQARALVDARIREAPNDPPATFLLSQIRNAFGEHATALPLAERAIALDGSVAKCHRQLAEVIGVVAQHANAVRQLLLARRFRKEIEPALTLDPKDVQALRDLLEFHLLAPGLLGGEQRKAAAITARIGAIDAAEGFLDKAQIAAFHKQTAEAELLTRQAVEARRPSYRARIALAQLYLVREGPASRAAEAEAKEALSLDSGRADAQAAERLLATGRDLGRAESYLRLYLGQEPEGNQPTASEARLKLSLVLQTAHSAAPAGAPKPANSERVQ
jgi:tetratricopeptide (TPR) repeat protein